ncbi:hypothetical protein AAFF_G00431050 [Aldrovandia affinis]|uniref:Uncharacterized protein n=1 Tax=Aldrovandia affinis TaxID=143900 RepID=A0AAD7S912_9TELE|nr:hypothetical protein AAFF_G00431050 [Aldrovandia affinis]
MSRLPIDHPEVHQQFMHGGFSVQLGSQNPYGRIPVDQTIEETVNRDTQTAGGTRGFSLKQAAVEMYVLPDFWVPQQLPLAAQKDGGTRNVPLQPPRPADA